MWQSMGVGYGGRKSVVIGGFDGSGVFELAAV